MTLSPCFGHAFPRGVKEVLRVCSALLHVYTSVMSVKGFIVHSARLTFPRCINNGEALYGFGSGTEEAQGSWDWLGFLSFLPEIQALMDVLYFPLQGQVLQREKDSWRN